MKKIITAFALVIALSSANSVNAQIRFSLNFNVSSQPSWGPQGYNHVEYYYLPDIEAYYYVPRHEFVYLSGNRWVFSASLPPRYRNYDLYSGYKVVVNQPYAYNHFNQHRVQYQHFKGYRDNRPRNNDRNNDRRNRRGY